MVERTVAHMTSAQVPAAIQSLIDDLVRLRPAPASIWLIGSRANGTATDRSDTDLLVFASTAFLEETRLKLLPREGVDLLVVHDGLNYVDPWQAKAGSLDALKWRELTDRSATYVGTKWVPDNLGEDGAGPTTGKLLLTTQQGIRLWPA